MFVFFGCRLLIVLGWLFYEFCWVVCLLFVYFGWFSGFCCLVSGISCVIGIVLGVLISCLCLCCLFGLCDVIVFFGVGVAWFWWCVCCCVVLL